MANNQAEGVFTLLQVCSSIKATFVSRYKSNYWVKAEMNKLNIYKYSGHAYPDLVEKQNGKIVAQLRSIIWKGDFERINAQFQQKLGEPLKEGIKILCLCSITFDPVYGLTLRIHDIDVNFTLGDLENEKMRSIQKLKQLHLFNKNKVLSFPLLPQRIAVMSVESSKGYADFLKVIQNDDHNYKLEHSLFPCLLQGDKAVKSMLKALAAIKERVHEFDAVAVIRGGGAEIGLSCFNHFDLAKAFCEFPLPVLSGIGHATNETVCEMVTYKNLITPTALGGFIIEKFDQINEQLLNYRKGILYNSDNLVKQYIFQNQLIGKQLWNSAKACINIKKMEIKEMPFRVFKASSNQILFKSAAFNHQSEILYKNTKGYLKTKEDALQQISGKINYLSPNSTLKRGYSLSFINGKPLTSIKLEEGMHLTTLTENKIITSEIKSIKNEKTNI